MCTKVKEKIYSSISWQTFELPILEKWRWRDAYISGSDRSSSVESAVALFIADDGAVEPLLCDYVYSRLKKLHSEITTNISLQMHCKLS